MKGRKPIPRLLKIANGNPAKENLNYEDLTPQGDLTAPPEWFSESQVEAWNYCIANAPEGLLRRLDREVLITFVQAKDLHQRAAIDIQENGITMLSSKGMPMQNPAIGILNKQAAVLLKAAEQMGFSPVARARVRVAPAQPKADEWDEILSA